MTERRYRVGPVTVALIAEGRAVDAFTRTLSPFLTESEADARVIFEHRADDDGARTVPLPRVNGSSVAAAGLSARYAPEQHALYVARAEGSGEVANAFRWLLARELLAKDAVLVHGCGVRHHSVGALFTGQSGAGKSTLAAAATRGGVEVLGDELVVVVDGKRPLVFGTPWNTGAPLDAELRLFGGLGWEKRASLAPMDASEVLRVATNNVLLSGEDPQTRAHVMRILISVIGKVRTARLLFAPDPSVAETLRQVLG